MRNALIAAVIAAAGFSSAALAEGLTVGVSWSNFQEERWKTDEAAIKAAGKESAAVLGFSSAIGAFGAFFIPKSFGSSIALTGGPEVALYVFVGYYVSCILVTWWWYSRKGAETPC